MIRRSALPVTALLGSLAAAAPGVAQTPDASATQARDPGVVIDLNVLDRLGSTPAPSGRRSLPLPPDLLDNPEPPAPQQSRARQPAEPPVARQPAPETRQPEAQPGTSAATEDPLELRREPQEPSDIPPPVAIVPTPPPVTIPPPPAEASALPPPAEPIERPARIVEPPAPLPDTPGAEPDAQPQRGPAETPTARSTSLPGSVPEPVSLGFAAGDSTIAEPAAQQLATAIAWLDANPDGRLTITAYADGDNRSKARQLSFQRGLAVRSWLLQRGISDARLDVAARGYAADSGSLDRVDLSFTGR